jgi:hypothetical protein
VVGAVVPPVAEYDAEPNMRGYGNVPNIQPEESFDNYIPSNSNSGLNDLYSDAEKKELKRAVDAVRGIPNDGRHIRPPIRQIDRMPTPFQTVDAYPAALTAPVPMTPDELDSYNRRVRKAATHTFLKRAEVCLNCEYFLAYTRGTDKQRLTLCRFSGVSPWDKNFTCGTSRCKDYLEIGSETPDSVQPVEKKKRKRRSRAEMEASRNSMNHNIMLGATIMEELLQEGLIQPTTSTQTDTETE